MIKCIAVCGAAFLLLLLLNYRYARVMEDPYADAHKFDYMDSDYNNIQISSIGSSHGEYAFDYNELSGQDGYECFNFAMASQTYNYDLAILSMYRDHFAEHSIMFIPISYFSFNNEVINETEQEFLNAKYYTFLAPQFIPGYDPYVDLITHRLPILSAGADIIKIFPFLSLKVLPAEGKIPFPEELYEKTKGRYERHMADKEEYFMPERINDLYAILAFCNSNNITPILITTPYTSLYTDMISKQFKADFYDTINTVASDTEVPYYDYSEDTRFSDNPEYFSDSDHLNTKGALYFMNIIKKEIPEFREFLSNNKPIHSE